MSDEDSGGPLRTKNRTKKDQNILREESKHRQKLLRAQMKDLFHELASVIRPPLDPQHEKTKAILQRAIEYIRQTNLALDQNKNANLSPIYSNSSPLSQSVTDSPILQTESSLYNLPWSDSLIPNDEYTNFGIGTPFDQESLDYFPDLPLVPGLDREILPNPLLSTNYQSCSYSYNQPIYQPYMETNSQHLEESLKKLTIQAETEDDVLDAIVSLDVQIIGENS